MGAHSNYPPDVKCWCGEIHGDTTPRETCGDSTCGCAEEVESWLP